MDKQNFKMSIKAKVNCPPSAPHSYAEQYHGKDVMIIDFVTTVQGLVAIGLIENENNYSFIPLFMSELTIEKNK